MNVADRMTEALQQLALAEQTFGLEEERTRCEESFCALVKRQSRFVFRVAYSILRNVQDSEDVVQELFLKLYRNGTWHSMQNERAFLARAAWRIAVDRVSKVNSNVANSDAVFEGDSPEQAAITADSNAAIHRLIDALPEELRQPLALSTVEDLSSAEIAAIMGIPQGTVRSRLSRARQVLRHKLETVRAGRYGH